MPPYRARRDEDENVFDAPVSDHAQEPQREYEPQQPPMSDYDRMHTYDTPYEEERRNFAEEERRRAEEEEQRRFEEEERRRAEDEEQRRLEAEERRRIAEEDRRRAAEEDRRRVAEEERRRVVEEERRRVVERTEITENVTIEYRDNVQSSAPLYDTPDPDDEPYTQGMKAPEQEPDVPVLRDANYQLPKLYDEEKPEEKKPFNAVKYVTSSSYSCQL